VLPSLGESIQKYSTFERFRFDLPLTSAIQTPARRHFVPLLAGVTTKRLAPNLIMWSLMSASTVATESQPACQTLSAKITHCLICKYSKKADIETSLQYTRSCTESQSYSVRPTSTSEEEDMKQIMLKRVLLYFRSKLISRRKLSL